MFVCIHRLAVGVAAVVGRASQSVSRQAPSPSTGVLGVLTRGYSEYSPGGTRSPRTRVLGVLTGGTRSTRSTGLPSSLRGDGFRLSAELPTGYRPRPSTHARTHAALTRIAVLRVLTQYSDFGPRARGACMSSTAHCPCRHPMHGLSCSATSHRRIPRRSVAALLRCRRRVGPVRRATAAVRHRPAQRAARLVPSGPVGLSAAARPGALALQRCAAARPLAQRWRPIGGAGVLAGYSRGPHECAWFAQPQRTAATSTRNAAAKADQGRGVLRRYSQGTHGVLGAVSIAARLAALPARCLRAQRTIKGACRRGCAMRRSRSRRASRASRCGRSRSCRRVTLAAQGRRHGARSACTYAHTRTRTHAREHPRIQARTRTQLRTDIISGLHANRDC